MSFKSWSTGTEAPTVFSSWDELKEVVNARWKELDNPDWGDMRLLAKELDISFSEVFEALGWKDYFDFV